MRIFGYNDKELMRMLRGTDAAADRALSYIYARIWPRIQGTWRKDGRDPDDARDAFQHAVLELWQFAQTQPDQREMRIEPWLYRVAHNHWLNHRAKRDRLEEAADELRFRFLEPSNPDHARTLQEAIDHLLARLDDACRRILEARFLDGLDRPQIAALLQFTNLNSVSNKIDRCLDRAHQLGREMGIASF